MAYVGVLPYSVDPVSGEFYLLLGREHPERGWNDQSKWAHFGGGMESKDKSPLEGSAREAYEESMGFLGSLEEIVSRLNDNFLLHSGTLYVYLMFIPYNPDLPKLYRNVYNYFLRCSSPHPYKHGFNHLPTCPEGYYEKTAIDWFSARGLYQSINGQSGTGPELRYGFDSILQQIFAKFNMNLN